MEPASAIDALGRMVKLCHDNEAYLDWYVGDLRELFIPPAEAGQVRIFQADGVDVGFFTWAQFRPVVADLIRRYGANPRPYEWTEGDRLWIIDMVCRPDFSQRAALWIQRQLFTDAFLAQRGLDPTVPAEALRRNSDKSVRKIAHFPRRSHPPR